MLLSRVPACLVQYRNMMVFYKYKNSKGRNKILLSTSHVISEKPPWIDPDF